VICGAGLAGLSAAYFLAVQHGQQNILLIDELPPLSLTSDHSTECYRNWWPGPNHAMVDLMNRSIDLLEDLARKNRNIFQLNRRGYLYCSADPDSPDRFRAEAACIYGEKAAQPGGGLLRIHTSTSELGAYLPLRTEGFENSPDGADLLLDADLIQQRFPFLATEVKAALHVRRAGWLSAQQLGMFFLEQARQAGVQIGRGKVIEVEVSAGRVSGVRLEDGLRIETNIFVNAAGPYIQDIAHMIGVDLPVYNEIHLKLAIKDSQGFLDRNAPLVIWCDAQKLNWTPDEAAALANEQGDSPLLGMLPAGVHCRPEGGAGSEMVLILWEYLTRVSPPVFPIPEDALYPEVVLRGLTRLIPAMQVYTQKIPRPRLDGGYYTRTRENRPLICKLPVEGAYLIGALSGFGVMACCAAGELLANHVTRSALPAYAPYFALERYQDPLYLEQLERWNDSAQL